MTDLEPHADSVPPAPAEVLALLGANSHLLIDEVLTSAGLINQGEQRWASSKGSLFKEFGAPYELVLTPLQVVADDWLPKRRLNLGEIFTEAHHHGDQAAAAADLLLAARGDGSSSSAARSLPPFLLNEVGILASQPAGPVVQTSVVAEPPAAHMTGSSGRLRAIAADSIEIVRQRWLWEGMLPIGTVCLLAGRESVGKSTCSLELAAETTRGGPTRRPGGRPPQRGDCGHRRLLVDNDRAASDGRRCRSQQGLPALNSDRAGTGQRGCDAARGSQRL